MMMLTKMMMMVVIIIIMIKIMNQVVVGDHDVTQGDGEQRVNINISSIFIFIFYGLTVHISDNIEMYWQFLPFFTPAPWISVALLSRYQRHFLI